MYVHNNIKSLHTTTYKELACVPALHAGKIEKLVWWESTVMSLIIIYVFYIIGTCHTCIIFTFKNVIVYSAYESYICICYMLNDMNMQAHLITQLELRYRPHYLTRTTLCSKTSNRYYPPVIRMLNTVKCTAWGNTKQQLQVLHSSSSKNYNLCTFYVTLKLIMHCKTFPFVWVA